MMVKILAIGDFHGKFPKKLQKFMNEVDLVISVGDYPSWSFRKEFFKYCYGTDRDLSEFIDVEKLEAGLLKDLKSADDVLRILNSSGKPVLTTIGNYDFHNVNDSFDVPILANDEDLFSKAIASFPKIKRIDYKAIKFRDIVLIGGYGSMLPGIPESKNFKSHFKILQKLFRQFSRENKKRKVLFVTHNMPYNCKLDKIRDEEAPKESFGQHYGSKLIRKVIEKYQPVLLIGGHFHENQGKTRIGKTTVVNVGEAGKGECAVIDFDEKMGKIKSLKFVK